MTETIKLPDYYEPDWGHSFPSSESVGDNQ